MREHPSRAVLRSRLLSLGAGLALLVPSVAAPAVTLAGHMVPGVGTHPQVVVEKKEAIDPIFSCQTVGLDDLVNGPACYSPQSIQKAYGISALLAKGDTGKGRTIVIVDAFGNPFIQTDLAIFDSTFGLPSSVFTVTTMPGTPAFDFNNGDAVGWSEEISLDVQWAHAVAPGANINLVVSKSDQDADILAATKYAVDHNLGDVISQSFGEAESCVDPKIDKAEHALFERATQKGITLLASSGDSGATQPSCDGSSQILSASSPAADPLVTGVGGTNLQADLTTGAYEFERAWADFATTDNDGNPICYPPSAEGCSGGGFSTQFARPGFQAGTAGIPRGARGVPDVAYNGGVDGGVLLHIGVVNVVFGIGAPDDPNIFFLIGGTSAGSPQWAGLVALADQLGHHRIGSMNDTLYAISHTPVLYAAAFHDIRTGNNNFAGITGYQTSKGWDPVTGLGTPKANVLVPLLALSN